MLGTSKTRCYCKILKRRECLKDENELVEERFYCAKQVVGIVETKGTIPTLGLPTEAQARKDTPIYSGVIRYFPNALAAVAECSFKGNDQHNPGTPLHWDRSKSGDELDSLVRHVLDAGSIDSDGIRHSTKVAWRALANLQKELERAAESERD